MSNRVLFLIACCLPLWLQAQFVYGDLLPDAPELAQRGEYVVGVQTLSFTNPNQLNLLEPNGNETPTYDRELTVEIWYPASFGDPEATIAYPEVMGTAGDSTRPVVPFQFLGRAIRDVAPKKDQGAFPLIIVSHGYVGSRYLMTYLTENLASKGYVVAAIDHTDATFQDAGPFHSTLYYRSLDVLFVLDMLDRLSKSRTNDTFNGVIDPNRTGLIGFSMGGYGVLNVGGAGYSSQLINFFSANTKGCTAIKRRCMGDEDYPKVVDSRIKAIAAFAPWGQNFQIWNEDGLQGLQPPTFLIAGDQDDISGYENGTKAIYEGAVNAKERYLLTYEGARHNVAPNPPPPEALAPGLHIDEYLRYADSVWDTRRMNNINQHFLTAFFGKHLQEKEELGAYLSIPEDANTNAWTGFKPRTAVGLTLAQEKQ